MKAKLIYHLCLWQLDCLMAPSISQSSCCLAKFLFLVVFIVLATWCETSQGLTAITTSGCKSSANLSNFGRFMEAVGIWMIRL